MGKGKPRQDPNKIHNQWGGDWTCDYCHDTKHNGKEVMICEQGYDKVGLPKCKGNRHNCCKVTYKKEAILKQNGKSKEQRKRYY